MSALAKIPDVNRCMLVGVRGIAALWIFIGHMFFNPVYHMGFTSREGLGILEPIVLFRFLGVDMFFMLSGCMLYLKYQDYFEQPTKSKDIDLFYAQRIGRLYPLYLLSIAIIAAFHWLNIPHPIFSGREDELFEHWQFTLLLNLLFMNAWGIVAQASWNEPAWTLSIFMLCYVVFPNIVMLLKRAPKKSLAGLMLVYLLLAAYAIARYYVPILTGETLSHSDGTGALMRGLFFFVIGCQLARIFRYAAIQSWKWHMILPITLMCMFCLMWGWFYIEQFDMLLFHLLYPFFILGLLCSQGKLSHLLFANSVILWLGTISYGIYLLHYPACLLIDYLFGQQLQQIATGHVLLDSWIYALVIMFVCFISHLANIYIEKPANRWLKLKLTNRKAKTTN